MKTEQIEQTHFSEKNPTKTGMQQKIETKKILLRI
jgi:hypothetical protein